MKKIKFSKKNLNIWVESSDGRIKLIKVPFKLKSQFIQKFMRDNQLPKEMEVAEWIINMKDGFYI
jgi:hypothetical protein